MYAQLYINYHAKLYHQASAAFSHTAQHDIFIFIINISEILFDVTFQAIYFLFHNA